ncbi:MAG: 4Fe-4S dicluster domain-containing protein [Chloroflexota bacterium]|nr:4Fe-4S dicluster domain-containing protein [Chloroflexota bacterium]
MDAQPASSNEQPQQLTRRGFVKSAVAAGAAFVALDAFGGVSIALGAGPKQTQQSNGVIYPDPTLCIGCLTCEVICSQVHREHGLSGVPRIRIYNDASTKVDPVVTEAYPGRGSFHQQPCLQCPTAECLYVCPVHALRIDAKTGARYIAEDTCVTCGRCANACPFPVSPESQATNQLKMGQNTRITYDPAKDTYAKCDLCYWREGGPACVERCPINIRIKQGILKTDKMCLAEPKADKATWDKLRAFQTFAGSPAAGKK